jgi:putative endopeptidase
MTIRFTHPATRLACAAAFAALVFGASNATAQTASPGEPSKARLTTLDVGAMDSGTAACTDFYQYANGGWLTAHPIPSDRPRWGTFDELFQRNQNDLREILERLAADRSSAEGSEERKLGDFYASCMDEAAIETKGLSPIEPELARIEAVRNAAGLRAEIGRLQSQGVGVVFAFGSEEDRKNSSQVIAAALQGGLGLPDRDYYLKKDAKSVELRKKYLTHVAKMLELAGAKPAKAAADAKAIAALETQLAQASMDNVEIRDPDKTHHPMSLDAFSKTNPGLEWAAFFRDQNLPADVSINVWQPDFFRAADKLLKSVPLATWKAYLRWHLLNAAAYALPKRFVDENFAFNGTILSGTPQIQPRWKRCVNATDGAMGMALGKLYVKEHFPPEAKRRADELVQNLLAALKDDIKTLSWMSEPTKQAALKKVEAFGTKIGYPDKWRDYSTLQVSRASYAGNAIAGTAFEVRRDFNKIGKPVDKSDWGMTPPEVNAYNNSAKNEIVFPAGILQPPFFYPDGDDAINYGAIGAVIGHEIIHGFDNSGRKFDAQGNQVDWWTAEDAKKFDEGASCIIKQFDGFVVDADVHEKGALVQGESIADLGGMTIAYRAYKKSLEGKPAPASIDGLTGDQRFFVANGRIWAANHRPEFAQLMAKTNEHPLGKFRSIGSVSNMPEFAQVFGCEAGSPMVHEPRCQIW